MPFYKGGIPWNKGKRGLQVSWNKGKKGLQTSWNKGLTKETDERLEKIGESVSKAMEGKIGKEASAYKPDLHIMETRVCKCGCGETFQCSTVSRQRFIHGHNKARLGKHYNVDQSGDKNPNYKPENHILETRVCECPDHEEFQCAKSSKQRFIVGHKNKGKHSSEKTRERIGKNHADMKGNKNPMFGKPAPKGTGIGKSGYFYSAKNNDTLYYRSSYELQAYKILEQMSKVIKYEVESLRIDYQRRGIKHTYVPDLLITYDDSSQEIIEIKPEYLLNDVNVLLKKEAGEKYAKEQDMDYSIWTELDLFCQKENRK